MSFDELCVRTRQEIAKRCDAALLRAGLLPAVCGESAAGTENRARFFFDSNELSSLLDSLKERVPEVMDEVVRRAERICQHRFDLLGYEAVDYGTEIDWHLDAVHGKRAPYRPWFQVRYLDFDQVGDSKVTWELNRHQHLVTLAKAYRLTNDARYAEELFRQWYQWQAKNPYPMGINWASSLEVAFRSLSWLWVWHLLAGEPVVPQNFRSDLWRALALSARHIERFLSTYFSPNTHLIGEAAGLFFIGTLCGELRSAKRWQKLGWQIVRREAERQVRADGMHFEQSLYYHTYALDFFLHARILAALNGTAVPRNFDENIEKMLGVLCALANAGPLPRFGDDDGGRVFDPRRNRTEQLLDPLATGGVLYKREDFNRAAAGPREETLWLLGTQCARRTENTAPQKKRIASFALEDSGIYVMANSKSAQQRLLITTGPRKAGRNGHRHADTLSVQVAVNGQELLVDPGTFSYARPDERKQLRETMGHNSVVIDGASQAEPAGPFGWKNLPDVRVERWITGNSFDLFAASHSGYERLAFPSRHHRHVFHLKSRFWLIRDVLEGIGTHQVEVAWHFAPGSASATRGGVRFISETQEGLDLLFASQRPSSHKIDRGWYSPVYGRKESCPVLRFSARAQLPTEVATLLVPSGNAVAGLGELRRVDADHETAAVQGYQYSSGDLMEYIFFSNAPRGWQLGEWVSDASFVYCLTTANNDVRQFVACDASYLMLGGRRIFSSDTHVATLEWTSQDNQHQILSATAANERCCHSEMLVS